MSRRSAQLDFAIRGDEQEQQRMRLEYNLQHTDLSLHLSSTPDEYSDVEYPRHASVPSPPFSAFASFDHRSGDEYDPHEQSRFQAWSYHSEDGIQPSTAGESLSTAAHHASALTISAGLGGGRGSRRDISLSGAEYDPERPLQGIVAGIAGRFKGFDANSTKSRQISVAEFDPLVVDDTAELDRVLQSGHAPPTTIRSARSSTPSSSSDSTGPLSPPLQHDSRPRLADALNHLTFSPKRPRNAQSPIISNASLRNPTPDRTALPRSHQRSSSPDALHASTPRPPRRMNQSLSYAQSNVTHSRIEPEVHIQPATPSVKQNSQDQGESSGFTARARGLQREIDAEVNAATKRSARQTAADAPKAYYHSTIASKQKRQRSPFKERTGRIPQAGTPFKKTVQLPDVTGLTSAIASPGRVEVEFYGYDPKDTTEGEARLIATLSIVQNKLTSLEQENSVSRRRVRELEIELEACKKEVIRERTRIMEHEQSIRDDEPVPSRRRADQRERVQQQKKKVDEDQAELAAAETRYKAAVEEKRALEALITTLRSHLTRLTAELSEHKELLMELRTLRDSDARTLSEKSKEVDKLRQEVERLAGEVTVLRGVVEEGLKERRNFREHQGLDAEGHPAEDSGDEEESEEESQRGPSPSRRAQPPTVQSDSSEEEEEEEEEEESISRRSPTPSPRRRLEGGAAEQTARTDFATVASSQSHSLNANVSRPFLDGEEVSRITQEVEERRFERSIQSRSQEESQSQSSLASREQSRSWSREPQPSRRVGSPSMMHEPQASGSTSPQVATVQLEYSVRFAGEQSQAEGSSRPASPRPDITARAPAPRPTAPTPAAASRSAAGQKRRTHTAPQPELDTPFPQIRGARLERLFFSAPDHRAETCAMCNREKRKHAAADEARMRSRERGRTRDYRADEEFGETQEDVRERERVAFLAKAARDRGSNRAPPQTVLARVLRELEDDFSHYKSIYVELADQYKDMDPASNVPKRNVLADHLREMIDILEQKGNQIASLYDLLAFKDKPVSESVVPEKPRSAPSTFGRAYARSS